MSLIDLLSSLSGLLLLIFKEFFSAAARSKALDQKFEFTQEAFFELVSRSVTTMRLQASQDSAQARTVEDQVELDLKKRESAAQTDAKGVEKPGE